MTKAGRYTKTEPIPEFKIEEITYGNGRTVFQVQQLMHGGYYCPQGGNFKSFAKAKAFLDGRIARLNASKVKKRKQVWP